MRHHHQAFGLIVRRINDEPFDVPSVPGSRAVTIKFMIPNSRMGSVIGKQGSKIKEIQDASGARLNASEGMLPGSTEVSVMHRRNFGIKALYALKTTACPKRGRGCGCDPHRDVLYRQHTHRGTRACAIIILQPFKLPPCELLSTSTVYWVILCPGLLIASPIHSISQPSTAIANAADLHSERPCRVHHREGWEQNQ